MNTINHFQQNINHEIKIEASQAWLPTSGAALSLHPVIIIGPVSDRNPSLNLFQNAHSKTH